jgi:putative transposase
LQELSLSRQCELLDLNRSSYYLKPSEESDYNLKLMTLIDEEYTRHPFYGSRRMTAWLRNQGHAVNRKRTQRLMQIMGLEAIYPKPNLSRASPDHKKFPYLLKGVEVSFPDQVWSTDITYIKLIGGFAFCIAIIDWFSRYVIAWRVSNTIDSSFCLEALEEALEKKRPQIFNTDQGTQFTSASFINVLEKAQVKISMDGRGRALDNIFVERLWRSLKYEDIYLKDYQAVNEARQGIDKYFCFYNNERLHQSLNDQVPRDMFIKR